MCEPTLIAAGIGAALTVAGGAAQKKQANEMARMQELEGRQRAQGANLEANQIREAGSRDLGKIRAIQSASGVDISTGSPAQVGGIQASNIEQEAMMKMYEGRLGLWRGGAQAAQSRAAGRNALISSVGEAATSLIGAGANAGYFDSTAATGPLAKAAKKQSSSLRFSSG